MSVAAIVYWASKQEAPQLPNTPTEILALLGAIALYALVTVVRAERWERLMVDEGAKPKRADMYALTVIGYMGNNILPARAGDAIRVVLAAPRAETSKRTVAGTLLAERLLDIVVLVVLFVVVGYGLLGEVGGDSVELIAVVAIVGVAALAVGWRIVTRNERLHGALAPIASATLGLRRAHHGIRLLAMTLADLGDRGRRVDVHRRRRRLPHGPDRGHVPGRAGQRVQPDPVRPRVRRHAGHGRDRRHQGAGRHRARPRSRTS